jgi:hypothetical protein
MSEMEAHASLIVAKQALPTLSHWDKEKLVDIKPITRDNLAIIWVVDRFHKESAEKMFNEAMAISKRK